MTARSLAYLDNPEAAHRLGLGLDAPPGHIIDELRFRWWFWARHGFRLPARPGIILFESHLQ